METHYRSIDNWSEHDFKTFLLWSVDLGCSDIVINAGQPVQNRLHGEWVVVCDGIPAERIDALVCLITGSDASPASIKTGRDIDIAYEAKRNRKNRERFRVNMTAFAPSAIDTEISIKLRPIPSQPPTAKSLGLPKDFTDALNADKGIILFTGSTGTGKSTSLAAMLRHLLETRSLHVGTYESPIEFQLTKIPGAKGPIEQIEIGRHLPTYKDAARNSTRGAYQAIYFGEMRDLETMRAGLELAETGHLVFSTLHTKTLANTLSRFITAFPSDERDVIASVFCDNLELVVQQRLYPCLNGGRIAAWEYLRFTHAHRKTLAEAPLADLTQTAEDLLSEYGVPLLSAVTALFDKGLIDKAHLDRVKEERGYE